MKETDKETFETWNAIASLYEEKFMDLDFYDETYDLFCDRVTTPNAKLLEIGCGPGNITKYLLDKRPDFVIHGIDVAPNMVSLAKKNNPTAHFEIMDAREILSLNVKFDGIVCGFCLPFLSAAEGEKMISDCQQLLNDNGTLYLSFMVGDPSQSGFKSASSGRRSYFNYHTLHKIENDLRKHHFERIKLFDIAYTRSASAKEIHTIIISKKIKDIK